MAATRVLFVGGDWKSQMPNYQGTTPLRGHFVLQAVEKIAPGTFDFTLWTSYEFLQYGDVESLRQFDVIVVGDTMGQSVMPRLVKAMTAFVEGGGGFLYCDNHKAFTFNTRELSFDAVLPIEMKPYLHYHTGASQPICTESPLTITPVIPDHPVLHGLAWQDAPPVKSAHYGAVKPGASVLATSPAGTPIWVAWEKGQGRVLWTGGVFANDELSADFASWADFGKYYAQALAWLGENSTYARPTITGAVATGTLVVDLAQTGPTVSAKHFGIHGQEDAPGGSYPMQGDDLALYQELKLDGTFARTENLPGIKRVPGGGQWDFEDDGEDITTFDWSKYDFSRGDIVRKDLDRIKADPVFLYWCPWKHTEQPLDPKRYTKYFAAVLERYNGNPASAEYTPYLKFFEIMNEPDLSPAETVLPQFTDFFNYAAGKLKSRYPGVKFGCGGFFEWGYLQEVIDRCGDNLGWISRHPYGHTGEAIFYQQDRFMEYARERGLTDLDFILTEWDFWIYGEPAFDYIMQRWKPLIDHADTCLGSIHYRWREYQEGGYTFGIHGEEDIPYCELPPEWPHPGKDQPITYRYNAFWAMRDCRGPQYQATLDIPALQESESQRTYAVATCDGTQFNIVAYYGYPRTDLQNGKRYETVKLRIQAPIPPEVQGRTLVIAHADAKTTTEEAPRTITGDFVDLEVEIPAFSAISLTVK